MALGLGHRGSHKGERWRRIAKKDHQEDKVNPKDLFLNRTFSGPLAGTSSCRESFLSVWSDTIVNWFVVFTVIFTWGGSSGREVKKVKGIWLVILVIS